MKDSEKALSNNALRYNNFWALLASAAWRQDCGWCKKDAAFWSRKTRSATALEAAGAEA